MCVCAYRLSGHVTKQATSASPSDAAVYWSCQWDILLGREEEHKSYLLRVGSSFRTRLVFKRIYKREEALRCQNVYLWVSSLDKFLNLSEGFAFEIFEKCDLPPVSEC